MGSILRSVLAVIAGIVTTFVVITAIDGISSLVYKLPDGADPNDREALRAAMAKMPAAALLIVLAGWLIGTGAGAWVAAIVAGRARIVHAMVIGSLSLLAGVANIVLLPHPVWFIVAGVAGVFPAAYLGARLVPRAEGKPFP